MRGMDGILVSKGWTCGVGGVCGDGMGGGGGGGGRCDARTRGCWRGHPQERLESTLNHTLRKCT